MKNIGFLFLLISIFSCSNSTPKRELLNPLAFEKSIANTSSFYLIDVRTKEEFKDGHLKNADNLNLLDGSFEEAIKGFDKNKSIYVYCAAGGRSGKAANILESKGFMHIVDMKGGYNSWILKDK